MAPAHVGGRRESTSHEDVKRGYRDHQINCHSGEPLPFDNPTQPASDILRTARNNSVIRGGIASLFLHPYEPLTDLRQIMVGIKAVGDKFVAASEL